MSSKCCRRSGQPDEAANARPPLKETQRKNKNNHLQQQQKQQQQQQHQPTEANPQPSLREATARVVLLLSAQVQSRHRPAIRRNRGLHLVLSLGRSPSNKLAEKPDTTLFTLFGPGRNKYRRLSVKLGP